MTTYLLLYTEPPTRRVFEKHRPGRLIFASDEVTPEDRAAYDECVELPHVADVPATLDALRRIRADVVVAQTEYGLLPGALLQDRGVEAAMRCTNKWLCRQALSRAGVPVPRFALVDGAPCVRRFAERWPVILKPVASTLARGVVRVDSPAGLDAAIARMRLPDLVDVRRLSAFAALAGVDMGCDPTRQFLVEEFVEGLPLEADGLVFGDRIDCFGAMEQVVAPDFRIEGYLFPADAAAAAAEPVVRALGLRDMGFAIEFRGSTVIEVNGRLGEDDGFPDLFHAALGDYPILKWMKGDAAPLAPRARAALAYRMGPAGGPPHAAWELATHPTSSRAAYELARAKLCAS